LVNHLLAGSLLLAKQDLQQQAGLVGQSVCIASAGLTNLPVVV
jgi:hypothetical protein